MAFSAITICGSCGAKNRIPAAHLADLGKCGKCKHPLNAVSEPLDVDSDSFREIVLAVKVPVLVDFWAEWCGPCKMAAPEVHRLAHEISGRALVLKVNTENDPQLASEFKVQAIPNFMVFRSGRPVLQRSGVAPRAEMRRWLESAA